MTAAATGGLIKSGRQLKQLAFNPDAPLLTFAEFGKADIGYKGETCRDQNGNIIAQVLRDSQNRVILSAVYNQNDNTIITTSSYDIDGGIGSKTVTFFNENGRATGTINLLNHQTIKEQIASLKSDSADSLSTDSSDMMLMSSTPEWPPSGLETFTYDHLGNRDQERQKNGYTRTYSQNAVNQYTKHEGYIPGEPYSLDYLYDDNGNLQNPRSWLDCTYDYRNRLIGEADQLEFAYDALGRRISKTSLNYFNVKTCFFYDPEGRVIAEYEDNSLEREFVFGNSQTEVLAMFTPYKEADPNDVAEYNAFIADWDCYATRACYREDYDYNHDGLITWDDFRYLCLNWDLNTIEAMDWYYLHDALGSVRGLVEANSLNEREFFNYDVYGRVDWAASRGNPYRFAGYRYDDSIGFYHTQYRSYDPETGRWLQFDPIGYADGMNLYEYVTNSPVMYTDPYGLLKNDLFQNTDDFWKQWPTNPQKIMNWFAKFEKEYGRYINQAAKKNCIPKGLLSSIIALEQIDYSGLEKWLEGQSSGMSSYGPAQISPKNAEK